MATATEVSPRQLQALITQMIPARMPLLIEGAPGIGKTDIITQATEAAGADLLCIYSACSDPIDPKGMPATWFDETEKEQKAGFIPFAYLMQMKRATKPLVVFYDDVGGAVPAVQLSIMNLVHARKTGDGEDISPFVTFIAATNRRQDRAGVAGMLEPFKSRFGTIVELVPDLDSWCNWALANNIPTEVIAFVRFRPNLLHDFKPSVDLTNSPCPRTVANVGKLLNLGLDRELEYPVISGAAGEAFAAEFLGFLRIYRQLPNPDTILMNPQAGEVPTDPATLYALCGALARKASDATIDRLTEYCNRLPAEFSVLLMRDAVKLSPEIQYCRGYVSWCTAHADVLL